MTPPRFKPGVKLTYVSPVTGSKTPVAYVKLRQLGRPHVIVKTLDGREVIVHPNNLTSDQS